MRTRALTTLFATIFFLLTPKVLQAGLTGLAQFQENDKDRTITLLGMVHHSPSPQIASLEQTQLTQVKEILKKRESAQPNKKLRVMIEHPYFIYSGDTFPSKVVAPYPTCANSLLQCKTDPNFQSTIFEDIEERKYSGAAFVCLDKKSSDLNENQNIVINGKVIALANFAVKDIKDEYQQLKESAQQNSHLFKNSAQSIFDYALDASQEACDEFDKTIQEIGSSDTEKVLTLVKRAEEFDVSKLTISDSFVVEDGHSVKTALSVMIESMVNPLFEFSLFSRIATSTENQALITGVSHAFVLKSLLERSNFKRTASHGSFIHIKAPLLQQEGLKSLLGSHTT